MLNNYLNLFNAYGYCSPVNLALYAPFFPNTHEQANKFYHGGWWDLNMVQFIVASKLCSSRLPIGIVRNDS